MNPSSLFDYTDSPSHSLSFVISLSQHCLPCLWHWVAFKPIGACLFFFSFGSLAPSVCPFKSPLSVKQSLWNAFRYGGHLFCNRKEHWHIEIQKISFLCLPREIHKKRWKICLNASYRTSNNIEFALKLQRVLLYISIASRKSQGMVFLCIWVYNEKPKIHKRNPTNGFISDFKIYVLLSINPIGSCYIAHRISSLFSDRRLRRSALSAVGASLLHGCWSLGITPYTVAMRYCNAIYRNRISPNLWAVG